MSNDRATFIRQRNHGNGPIDLTFTVAVKLMARPMRQHCGCSVAISLLHKRPGEDL